MFSVSALDLFASAMGAFLLVAVILFPFYKNESLEKLEQKLQELDGAQKQCAAAGAALQQVVDTTQRKRHDADRVLEDCLARENATYLAIVMRWPTKHHDIDLHVKDPSGRSYYYRRHNRGRSHFPNSDAELSSDTRRGPGIEVWEISKAPPGNYEITYVFFARYENPAPATISGTVYYRNGSKSLPQTTMHTQNEYRVIATVEVTPGGEVVIR